VPSIRENLAPASLPDTRSPGVWLRTLMFVNLATGLAVLAANREWGKLLAEFVEQAMLVEPITLVSLALFALIFEWLAALPRRMQTALILLLVLLVTAAVHGFLVATQLTHTEIGRTALWAILGAAFLLAWFALVARSQSPALAEARLLALTARIRPHFLFNSLNAVLGVMRSDPRRAETALEELAGLFRVLMRENAELTPLSEEIAVARQYLNLERLRLGDRMQVTWDMDSCPPDPLVPPLMLQPLLENAVYHGIEPSTEPGEIHIRFERLGDRLRLELSNPVSKASRPTHGNHMALANIRERLILFFELDAVMATGIQGGRFRVFIEFPYRPYVPYVSRYRDE